MTSNAHSLYLQLAELLPTLASGEWAEVPNSDIPSRSRKNRTTNVTNALRRKHGLVIQTRSTFTSLRVRLRLTPTPVNIAVFREEAFGVR